MEDDEAPCEYGLVMPFTACVSAGGPFDDSAFVAGWQAGEIDARLSLRREEHAAQVDSRIVPQLDLIAMRHGYQMRAELWAENPEAWTYVTFTPPPA